METKILISNIFFSSKKKKTFFSEGLFNVMFFIRRQKV
jgi:hypothetical protein